MTHRWRHTSRRLFACCGRASARSWRIARPALLVPAGLCAAATSALLVAVLCFPYPVDELNPSSGGPLIITDRHGALLRSVPSPDGRPGRENWVPLERIPSHALLTVIASEDAGFYEHRGVDARGIVRAMWLDLRARRAAYGGSTITMQLARMLHSADEPRSLTNKVRELVYALRMERAVSKSAILEQYLNRAYYGNGAYGIEAAAQTYFDKPATSLSVGEATLLAIVPRAPTAYDPVEHLDRALRRRAHVFGLLVERGLMTQAEVARASEQTLTPALHEKPLLAPHFTDWVLRSLPADVRARGGEVRTSLDLDLQQRLERRVAEHVDELGKRNLQQAGVVVLDTQSGEVLAMVGSAGFDETDGQINIVTRRRHPGSALKPFVYALAIEQGDNPASIAYDIHDVPSEYRVKTLTQKEHGPVRYRAALAGSFNLAAVHVLEKVGTARLMSVLRRAGVGALSGDADTYGLRLALGSAKVRLVDLAAAYGFLVKGGRVRPPQAVLEIRDGDGRIDRPARPLERRIFSPQTSWLVMDMLADPEARREVFGQELPLDLPFRVAAKTGTSRGFADTVAIAVTNEVTVAAWGGNFDGTPTHGLVAMQSAAPLVRAGLLLYAGGKPLTLPEPPSGITTAYVCPLSGELVSADCPHRKLEYFAVGHVPTEHCTWHRHEGDRLVIHYPPEVEPWAQRQRERGGRHLARSDGHAAH